MLSLIVGLGNIGPRYRLTRHNVGFMAVDWLANSKKAKWRSSFFKPFDRTTFETEVEAHSIVVAKPKKFMNRSGIVIKALLKRYQLSPDQMLVVVDDFNLPLGSLRFRRNGSDGGHNGLASIIETIGTDQFSRLRMGIGPLPSGVSVVDFVLGEFEEKEQQNVEDMIALTSDAIEFACVNTIEDAMGKYNKINPA